MPAPRPILIVDDDAALRASLAEHCALHQEFDAHEAGSAAEAEAELAAERRHDAVLLDIGLPDGDGRDLCARPRGRGSRSRS
jgi:DNA-binding response OmpR family regulator